MSSTLSKQEAADVIGDLRANIAKQYLDVEGWTDEVAADNAATRYLFDRFAGLISAEGPADRELLIDDLLFDHEQAQAGLLSL